MLLKVYRNNYNNSNCNNLNSGIFKYGYWTIESELFISDENGKIYNIGIGSDRKAPQYRIVIENECIQIISEPFGISPVFYFTNENCSIFSSKPESIRKALRGETELTINKEFILEQNLFNYSLFNATIYNEVFLVPSNSRVRITNEIKIEKEFNIEDLFIDQPISNKRCINDLTDLFVSLTESKIKDGDIISFTSGFDGRSLLAIALNFNKRISAYAFGASDNPDINIPLYQSKILNIPFIPVYLDSEDYRAYFSNHIVDIIKNSGANSNLLQVHWEYVSSVLKGGTEFIISGIFGSELFRAIHISGQLTSINLVSFFRNFLNDKWITDIRSSPTLDFLQKKNFKTEIDSVIDRLRLYNKEVKHLGVNQRFYKYVFEESFRKFFGMQFIQPMRNHCYIINPFLDLEFIKALLQTDLAGVNNTFFTDNPLKRFKGQKFYSDLICKMSPGLAGMSTGKGYSPGDLQDLKGKINIAGNYMTKRLKRKILQTNLDNLGIITSIGGNLFKLTNRINENYFKRETIENCIKSKNWTRKSDIRDKFVETLSTNFYLEINGKDSIIN